jgi:hypothetical protein
MRTDLSNGTCTECHSRQVSDAEHQEQPSDGASSPSSQVFPSTSKGMPASAAARSSISRSSPVEYSDSHPVDALATVGSVDDDSALYGKSSTISFVRQFVDSAHAGDRVRPILGRSQTASQLSYSSHPAPEVIFEKREGSDVLPPRRKADDFLRCFWEFVHPIFPVIHKTSFFTKYEQLWLPSEPERRNGTTIDPEEVVFTSNINLIFALGCQFSDLIPPGQKVSVANEFYQRSRQLFLFDILDSMSISLVQMLLLMGIYLQSTPHASRCWNSIGLAIRIAQSLGLHLENANQSLETQLHRQMRRRIWHTCVVLDR